MVKCQHCGKKYAKNGKHYLYHLTTCKAVKCEEKDEVIHSQREMRHIIKKLLKQNNDQQKKIEELERRVQKDIRKINMVEWLNTNQSNNINLETWLKKLIITMDDLLYIFNSDFMRGLELIISKNIIKDEIPFRAFSHKTKQLYIYDKSKWKKGSISDLKQIFGKIQLEILKVNREYEKTLDDDKIYGTNNQTYLINNNKIMIVDSKKKKQCEKFIEKILIDSIKQNLSDLEKFKFCL